jgi:DNA (cytosine-5-)-methyltransferase
VVSLFSGAGGLDLGAKLAAVSCAVGHERAYELLKDAPALDAAARGIDFVYSNDMYAAANDSYVRNFGGSVVKDSRDIRKVLRFPESDLILGGFPCPGFSAAGPRLLDDPRNFLYVHYIRALMHSRPAFFVAENVKGLMTMANGQVLQQITEDFSAAGYAVSAFLVNARDYGVPQVRERVFIVGVRQDIADEYGYVYEVPEPTHGPGREFPYVTLRDAIGDLPVAADDVYAGGYSSMYMSRNRKRGWGEQSFTIQASGRQAPQYPGGLPMVKVGRDEWVFQGELNRRLSVRECARIQSFPDWFYFSRGSGAASLNHQLGEQYKQIGNAVPVVLAEKVLRPILQFMYEHGLHG